jgi:dsDNA-specific endonuclease/ATPase MutS2
MEFLESGMGKCKDKSKDMSQNKNRDKGKPLPTLDLHGRTTDEVFDAMEDFINRENQRGTPRVRVMPGKGSGKVKAVVTDYLKRANYPWHYERLANGQNNEGVMIVILE